jgi:hypothetical protein
MATFFEVPRENSSYESCVHDCVPSANDRVERSSKNAIFRMTIMLKPLKNDSEVSGTESSLRSE